MKAISLATLFLAMVLGHASAQATCTFSEALSVLSNQVQEAHSARLLTLTFLRGPGLDDRERVCIAKKVTNGNDNKGAYYRFVVDCGPRGSLSYTNDDVLSIYHVYTNNCSLR